MSSLTKNLTNCAFGSVHIYVLYLQSISVEATFAPTSDPPTLLSTMRDLCKDLSAQLSTANITGARNVTVKVRFSSDCSI